MVQAIILHFAILILQRINDYESSSPRHFPGVQPIIPLAPNILHSIITRRPHIRIHILTRNTHQHGIIALWAHTSLNSCIPPQKSQNLPKLGTPNPGTRNTRAECTHLGCIAAWRPEVGKHICPCHGSEYDKTGAVLRGPAPRPLELAQV